ncbi:dihydroxyacetone kinase [Sebaldella termitidis]|uniref:DegV family protein n=1 Tax=Sebaldella termitidis (strain ATCC 33386 / NCTC 11300) TaxID=526218 RepID=D1AJX8_SEBTE|nr:DegV family protein [Sebaldella termitidis]ACZ07035.1 degV family protein [Sebaldella termitidis ATCC 33386]SUI22325.1 dihydroxyacetone kinase [Sebaldella termitidis]
MRIRYIDAKRLRMLLIAGSKWLVMHEEVLNELNVYPVPDGDTGSNMSMTISSVEKELTKVDEKSSMNEVSEAVEEAILMGARGNSGTILSQIITGFLKGIGDKDRLYAADVVTALESAKEVAYKAVNQPVEGTILTVIRKVAESAREYVKTSDDLVGLLENIKDTAQEAVEQTPEELPKLKEAGVVDAGAKGLFYMLEGFYMLITQADLIEEIEPTEVKNADFSSTIANIDHDPDSIKFQYCTEFIIGSSSFDTDKFKAEILELGDSAVFAQSSKKFKVHVHTNNPGQALELALKNGDLEKVKIENMKLQHENLYVKQPDEEGAKIFVSDKVTLSEKGHIIVADTENLKNEFLKNGADVVILGGQSKNPSVQDILNALEKLDKKIIYIYPNNKNIISTAKLACGKSDKNAVVMETRTMLEGNFYIKDRNDEIEKLMEEEKRNVSIEVTKAVRDTKVDDLEIKQGNYIALINGKIKYAENDLKTLVSNVLDQNITKDTMTITVAEGSEKDEQCKKLIEEKSARLYKTFINGNQENYYYYIYLENKNPNMPEIAILTDSTSDLVPEEVMNLPISIVPLKVEFDGNLYKDIFEISRTQVWEEILKTNTGLKTSQPAPQDFLKAYKRLFEKGYKKILSIHISSKLSGTSQSAQVAKNLLEEKDNIEILDSLTTTSALGHLVTEAAKKSLKRESAQSIVSWVENTRSKARFLIALNDLKFLEKGGRIGKATSYIGSALHLKPIIGVRNGEVIPEKKVIGEMGVMNYIRKTIKQETENQSVYLYVVWAGVARSLDVADKIAKEYEKNPKVTVVNIKLVGPVIGSHVGSGFGIITYPKLS